MEEHESQSLQHVQSRPIQSSPQSQQVNVNNTIVNNGIIYDLTVGSSSMNSPFATIASETVDTDNNNNTNI